MQRIGIISDTHLKTPNPKKIPKEIYTAFQNVDAILHAGDINAPWVIEELEELAPVYAVLGNTDNPRELSNCPISQRVAIEDCVIGLTHGDTFREPRVKPIIQATGNMQTAANALSYFQFEDDVNAIIFGHSHFPLVLWHEFKGQKVLLVNPGSAVQKRAASHCGCAVIEISGKRMSVEQSHW